MDIKTIKKAGGTLTGFIISLLIVIGVFIALFNFMTFNAENSGITVDTKYNDSASQLESARANLSINIGKIEANLQNVSEATSIYQVAWNGLKGLGNTVKLPLNFLAQTRAVWNALKISIDLIPDWIVDIFLIGLVTFFILLIASLLKGEPRM